MNTYRIFLRRVTEVELEAYDYTEVKRQGRFYFHSDPKKSDKRTFFCVRDVAGIRVVQKNETQRLTHEQLAQALESFPDASSSSRRKVK